MLDGNDIAILMRDALRDIPALVALLGSAGRITVYDETEVTGQDIFQVIAQLEPGTVTIVYAGWTLPPAPASYRHDFSLVVRPKPGAKPTDLQELIVNGVPAGGNGDPFQLLQLSEALLPGQFVRGGRRTVVIGEDSRFTYWEMAFQVAEAGMS